MEEVVLALGLQLLVELPMYWEDEIGKQRSLLGPDGEGHLGYSKELGSYCKLSREVIGDCIRDTLRWDMGMILSRMELDSEK